MIPVLDYVPRLDPRNLDHRVTAEPAALDRSVFWTPGRTVLDQGREGACVGFGIAGEAAASPARVQNITNSDALAIYNLAKQLDEWEGVDYEGTSVRAGMLVGRDLGFWTGFKWATNLAALRAALDVGTVVIGIEWREDMYSAPNGILTSTGPVVGGHCLLITGYSRWHYRLKAPAFRLRNSWGAEWGINGSAYIRADELADLVFGRGGEAAIAVNRAVV